MATDFLSVGTQKYHLKGIFNHPFPPAMHIYEKHFYEIKGKVFFVKFLLLERKVYQNTIKMFLEAFFDTKNKSTSCKFIHIPLCHRRRDGKIFGRLQIDSGV